MNLIAGLLILICLVGSELIGAHAADDWMQRVAAVFLTAAMVPAIAFFQTSALIYKIRRESFSHDVQQTLCRRMTVSHALVWLSASTAIVWALRWQDVVRGNWHLDRWPLVDELAILAPAILSMLASWAVFYELQVAVGGNTNSDSCRRGPRGEKAGLKMMFDRLQARMDFVSIRFRVYFLLVLIPVGCVVLLRDTATLMVSMTESVQAIFSIASLIVLMLAFPFLMLLVWNSGPIANPQLREKLKTICHQQRLRVLDVRVWRTGNQIINAAVVGWFPKMRIIFLSDGLLNQFEPDEVEAVLRHEAGHIRRWHVPLRLFFLLTPILSWLVYLGADLSNLKWDVATINAPAIWLPILLLAIYEILVVRWLSHAMEHEADWHSARQDQPSIQHDESAAGMLSQDKHETGKICSRRAAKMRSALLRLAAFSPSELDRNTLLHPSLRRRIEFLEQLQTSEEIGHQFGNSFLVRKVLLATGLAAVFVLSLLCG